MLASRLRAPSLDDFAAIAKHAFELMPAHLRALTGDVAFTVADFPEPDVLRDLGAETPFDLLGLFQGTGLVDGEALSATGQMPNRIWLYRRPILDYWAAQDETLEAIIIHVMIHEIGHHFGLTDADMEALESAAG